jgi:hypothetical protein
MTERRKRAIEETITENQQVGSIISFPISSCFLVTYSY